MRQIYEGLGVSQDLVFCELNPDGFDHIIIGNQQFDIPKGSAREVEHGRTVSDYTIWTSAADLKNRRYHFRTYENSRIRMVDLARFDLDGPTPSVISMKGPEQIEDVSNRK